MPDKPTDPTPPAAALAGVDIQPVTLERWGDLETLFHTSPVMSSCWCMSQRTRASEFTRFGSAARQRNREAMHGLVAAGTIPGLLAYVDGRPVGWISVGPREQYARIQHSPALRPVDDLPVWSIVCMYTHPDYRRQGLTLALIQAAVQHAAVHEAAAVEAYPLAEWGGKVGVSDAYTGMAGTFRELGFEAMRVAGSNRGTPRLIMRYPLRGR